MANVANPWGMLFSIQQCAHIAKFWVLAIPQTLVLALSNNLPGFVRCKMSSMLLMTCISLEFA